MKKSLIIIFMIFMMICICGCEEKNEYTEIYEKDPSEFIEEGANTYNSLAEINEAIGCNIVEPSVMGKSMELYSVKDDTAIYQCLLAGCEFTIKASKNVLTAEDTLLSRDFMVNEFHYLITVPKDGAMGEDVFDYICDDVKTSIETAASSTNNSNSLLIGSYMDEISQRATAEVIDNGDGTLSFNIEWADSASETNKWNIVFTEGDILEITTCTYQKVSFDDAGVETILEESEVDGCTLKLVDNKINCGLIFNGDTLNFSFVKTS